MDAVSMILDVGVKPITRTLLMFELKITPNFEELECLPIDVVVEDRSIIIDKKIVHSQYFMLKKQYVGETTTLNFPVEIHGPLPKEFILDIHNFLSYFNHEPITVAVPLTHIVLPEEEEYHPLPAEAFDVQSLLPVASLGNTSYEALYQNQFKQFNKIQTHAFQVLYKSDDNVFLAAPTGSGKTTCAEIAILRNHQKGHMRVVYIAPIRAIAQNQYREWKTKFGGGLNSMIVELTGENETDLKLLEEGQIIITTPQIWDALSRQWKQIIQIQQVPLLILDDLHFIGGPEGHILERIIVRMKQISTRVGKKMRIVALSAPITNGKDIGEWIGATSHSLFNFSPTARHVPLELFIKVVEFSDLRSANPLVRLKEMAKITHSFITEHAKKGKPILVYVPTWENVSRTVFNMISVSQAKSWVQLNSQQHQAFEASICKISNLELKSALALGVGFLHEGLNTNDQEFVIRSFEAGLIKICIISSSMCWEVSLSAHIVVLMGTEYYDFDGPSYPITDILHMMGQAGRRLIDSVGKALILCLPNKKRYYNILLRDLLPIESHFHNCLNDTVNAEIVAGIVENFKDAVDYLEKSFLCRRLPKNPSYYDFPGFIGEDAGTHLSSLVQRSMNELMTSGMVRDEGGDNISSSVLGRIASNNYINYRTIGAFSTRITLDSNIRDLLEILWSATEFEAHPTRRLHVEEDEIRVLIAKEKFPHVDNRVTNPQTKAIALLQAHFSRLPISSMNLEADRREVVLLFEKLLIGLMEVISDRRWILSYARAMEINQILIQAIWHDDPILLQLPHFTRELVDKCNDINIQNFYDLKTTERQNVRELLGLTTSEWMDITRFMEYNSFPIKHHVRMDEIFSRQRRTVDVILRTKRKRNEILIKFPHYPCKRRIKWWVFVLDDQDNVLAFKSVSLWTPNMLDVTLRFTSPVQTESASYNLYFVCDSIKGVTERRSFHVKGCAVD
ncbi:putative RNA helicase [Medicago truncatula]|uniref:Putative RNA helicase n=1 Tax=Medicago truncatula TaxID=3880 RepID=A0A072VFX1_MEDTR|nr:DExH-box ATP-dependent RNA helicase DExH12 [Medicago truncatula]KEH37075.1 U5 small nuclear ribonucleoprotein 200 kDa helicase [Medicago truncatula]RHN72912.1 putative RNA helicase [Medicago truncatula]